MSWLLPVRNVPCQSSKCSPRVSQIFVKNIHFFATLLDHVAKELDVEVGEYTHWITNLCYDRDATSC